MESTGWLFSSLFPGQIVNFAEGGKLEYPEENLRSRDENQQQTQPTYDTESENRTQAVLVGGCMGGECSTTAGRMTDFSNFYPTYARQQFQTTSLAITWLLFPSFLVGFEIKNLLGHLTP